MTHDELMKLSFLIDPGTNNRVAADNKELMNVEKYSLAFGPRVTIDAKFLNLLTAAPNLYQALTYQFESLQLILDAIESTSRDEASKRLCTALVELQNGCMLAQRVAQVGVNEVAESLKRGKP